MRGQTLVIVTLVLLAIVILLFWRGHLTLDGSDIVVAFRDASMRPAIVLGDPDVFIHDSYAIIAIPVWIPTAGFALLLGLLGSLYYNSNQENKAAEQQDEPER